MHGAVAYLAEPREHCRVPGMCCEGFCLCSERAAGMGSAWSSASLFPGAAITKYHQLGNLKRQKTYFLPVLEARCPKSKCWRGCAASEEERIFLASCSSDSCGCLAPFSASVVTVPPPLLCVLSLSLRRISLCLSVGRTRVMHLGPGWSRLRCLLSTSFT